MRQSRDSNKGYWPKKGERYWPEEGERYWPEEGERYWPEEGVGVFLLQNRMLAESVVADYRKVFLGSVEGKQVLTHLISHLCFFRDIKTEEERIRHNAAKEILSFCGLWSGGVGLEEEFTNRMAGFDLTERLPGGNDE